MSVDERLEASRISSSSSSIELDPLLKDLTERKLSFKRNVISLATELKNARIRLALQEKSYAHETHTRKAVEKKAKSMEEEISLLQKCLQEKDAELQESSSTKQLCLEELEELRYQLSITQATAEASEASSQSAQAQCLKLFRELDEKNHSIKDHEVRVNKLAEQLDLLQRDLQEREISQRQLKDEVMRTEKEILRAVQVAGVKQDCELRNTLAKVSPKNIENINKLLVAKDEEIARLREDIRTLSVHWKQKTEELESQLEKHRRANQELKKKVLKLDFCLQEARTQMRKLQKIGEKRDKALKELRDQLSKQQSGVSCNDRQKFWERTGFKVVMSMLVLAIVTRR